MSENIPQSRLMMGCPAPHFIAHSTKGMIDLTAYESRCASCHGDFGEAVDNWPVLVVGEGTLGNYDPVKTTGSYWPYASIMYDYIYRAMPFGEAQSLTHDETYQIVTYLLFMDDIIDDEFEVNQGNIGTIELPYRDGFMLPDPRPDAQPIAGVT